MESKGRLSGLCSCCMTVFTLLLIRHEMVGCGIKTKAETCDMEILVAYLCANMNKE